MAPLTLYQRLSTLSSGHLPIDEEKFSTGPDGVPRRASPLCGLSRVIIGLFSVLIVLVLADLTARAPSIPSKHRDGIYSKTYDVVSSGEELLAGQIFTESSHRLAAIQALYGMGAYENRTWIEHINSLDDDHLAPLTKFTQNYLMQHQYRTPSQCAEAKYFIWHATPDQLAGHGLGSTAHEGSWQLGSAIEGGRIFLYGDVAYGQPYVDENCRDSNGQRTLNCVFEEVSNCGLHNVNANNTVITMSGDSMPDESQGPRLWRQQIPSVFSRALDEHLPVKMSNAAKKYWWRAQGAAFLLRLKQENLALLREWRLDVAMQEGYTHPRDHANAHRVQMPFPLPKGTISMHVRHGDKGIEGDLAPFEKYVEAGERLANTDPYSLLKIGFVSTEDSDVIEQAHSLTALDMTGTTPNLDWIFYNSVIDRANTSPDQQLKQFGRSRMTVNWMLQLFMAIECDAFVGTRNSNWNQLIDQMRCVWLDKCSAPFAEILPANEWVDYWW